MTNEAPPHAADDHWSEYFDAVAGLPARETLVSALDAFEREDASGRPRWRIALDLGCGEGRDTRALLARRGPTRWRVLASDKAGDGLARLSSSLPESASANVRCVQCSMEEMPALFSRGVRVGGSGKLSRAVDLVNASFALPHCRPEAFPEVWTWLVQLIRARGRFAGQLFGVRDEWATKPDGITRTYHTREQVEALLSPFEVETLDEVERMGKNAFGEPKFWHVFHIVARKR